MRRSRYRTRLAVVATTSSVACLTALAAAPAAAPVSASPSHPNYPICEPKPGTVLSGKAVHHYRAWLPTNVKSANVAGPSTISHTVSKESSVGTTISASFEVDEGFIFASAKEQYGISLSKTASRSSSWSYSEHVPKGDTARVQQYHQGYEIGIVEHIMQQRYKDRWCVGKRFKDMTGNFFNKRSTGNPTYCYALISAGMRAHPELGRGCHNRLRKN